MTGRVRLRKRSSPALRAALLVSLVTIVRFVAPSFTLFGSWEGELDDIKGLPEALGPRSVNGLIADDGKVRLTVDHGHLNAQYADGPLSLKMDDTNAWEANYVNPRTSIRILGQGGDDMYWEASKRSALHGLGDVEVNMTSDHDYGVQVEPKLPNILGAKLKAKARYGGSGLYGRLDAERKLREDLDLTYSVENDEGVYDIDELSHLARLQGGFGDGSFDLQFGKTRDSQSYNASYAARLDKLLRGAASAVFGFDNDGVYGSFEKGHSIAKGLRGSYRASGRANFVDDEPVFSHSAKLIHDLGSLELSKVADEPILASLQSEITKGDTRLRGQMEYSFEEETPEFNLTVSHDLSKALHHLGAEGEVLAGIDDASIDGVYGKIAAKRNLGNGLSLQYSSQGRGSSADHTLKLSNALGQVELVKAQDVAPRLRVGYQVEV